MFDAAQAAIISLNTETLPKTHSGLISEFSRQLIKTERLPIEVGRSFNRVAEIRLIADYTNDSIPLDKAEWAVAEATDFIETIKNTLHA